MRKTRFAACLLLLAGGAVVAQTKPLTNTDSATNHEPSTNAQPAKREFVGWTTNGPAVLATYEIKLPTPPRTNALPRRPIPKNQKLGVLTEYAFERFLPESLNHLVWTNVIARTNGRSIAVWSVRTKPEGWPKKAPIAEWATNGLMWGMRGLTALSPCWESEGSVGQVPVTALTRRHGYTRGHSLGPEGFSTVFAGKKVWFFTLNNSVVSRTVVRSITHPGGRLDYTILLFDQDLPSSIEPLRVTTFTNVFAKHPMIRWAPWPIFKTEQGGRVSAEIPAFSVNTGKPGDSGSPNMLPLPGELVFFGGRATSGPEPQMQADMDELCRMEKLDPKRYQLQWVDLSAYPPYPQL
jgi:hypothetical protein